MRKKTRKKIDWEKIEGEYRTGQFSVSEIARRNNCSRGAIQKKVKAHGWTQDKTEQVRRIANAKMVALDAESSRQVAPCYVSDETELAAETRVAVLRSHRKDISKMQELEERLLHELLDSPKKLYITQHKGEIISQEVGIAVTEKSAALNNLANVQHKRIQLERQAFNLNDSKDDNGLESLKTFLDDLGSQNVGLPSESS